MLIVTEAINDIPMLIITEAISDISMLIITEAIAYRTAGFRPTLRDVPRNVRSLIGWLVCMLVENLYHHRRRQLDSFNIMGPCEGLIIELPHFVSP